MDVVEHVNGYYMVNLKINSSRYPKAYHLEIMKEWCSVSYLNSKVTLNTGIDKERTIHTMRYKYYWSKVILFCSMKEQAVQNISQNMLMK